MKYKVVNEFLYVADMTSFRPRTRSYRPAKPFLEQEKRESPATTNRQDARKEYRQNARSGALGVVPMATNCLQAGGGSTKARNPYLRVISMRPLTAHHLALRTHIYLLCFSRVQNY